ncbi:MAG: regulatory protein RecX [bacterium]|nr:regulatory protein RecX [bacterium]
MRKRRAYSKTAYRPVGTAIEYALRSLTRRRQSERQMREKLEKYFPDEDREAVVARLKELGYLNDAEFCQAWIRHRSLTSPRGAYVLRQELLRKGISAELIEASLQGLQEHELIEESAQKKWKNLKDPNVFSRKTKLLRFLISRGFAFANAKKVVNTLAAAAEE